MCIICNLIDPVKGVYVANDFLDKFSEANNKMRDAERLILEVAKFVGPEDAKRYRRTHKAMVRARRSWNRVEQSREEPSAPSA